MPYELCKGLTFTTIRLDGETLKENVRKALLRQSFSVIKVQAG